MVGRVGVEPTHPIGNGFTVRRASPTAPPTHMMRPLIFTRNGSLKPRLIRRVHSKSCHSGRALTQVIILQLPSTTPEGVTLYICTLFGCPSGARTQDTAVNSRMLVPTELRGNIKGFLFSYLIYYNIFFLKNQERFFT